MPVAPVERDAEPTAAVIDSQSVKANAVVAGDAGGLPTPGILKRHADTYRSTAAGLTARPQGPASLPLLTAAVLRRHG